MAQRRRSVRRQSAHSSGTMAQVGSAHVAGAVRLRPTSARPIPRSAIISASLLLGVVLAVLAVNWFFEVKRPGDEPILEVNKRVFRWSDYVRILLFQKLAVEYMGGQFQAGREPYNLMKTMTENELMKQAAPREGIHISESELHAELASRLLPNAKQISDPAELNSQLELRLGAFLDAVRITRRQYEDIVRFDLLRRQFGNKLGEAIPRVQPAVYLHLILAEMDQSENAEKQLDEGTTFETVARRFSNVENVEVNGGEIGWVPRKVIPGLDGYLFGWRLGDVGDPIETPEGWWVVRVVDRSTDGARLQGIRVDSSHTARDLQTRLRGGASFMDLATQFSTDPATRTNRGEMGVIQPGGQVDVFDEAIRGTEIGELIGPVMTRDGAYFAIVQDRSGAQEVGTAHFDVLKKSALTDWLNKEQSSNYVNYCPGGDHNCFGNVKVERALKEISSQSLTRAQEATAAAKANLNLQQRRS